MIVLDVETTGTTKLEAFDFSGDLEPFSAEADKLEDIVQKFLEWTSACPDITIADYEPSKTISLLGRAMNNCRIKSPLGHRAVDLHTLTYVSHAKSGKQMPMTEGLSNIGLEYIISYVGLPQMPQNKLRAKAEAFSRLIYNKPLFKEFKKAQLPPHFFYPQNETVEVERVVVCDVETTGLDPDRNSICDIGAVEFIRKELFERVCRIWDGAEVTKEAIAVNGYTEPQLRDPNKPSHERVMNEFHHWLRNRGILAGENPSFDQGFIIAAMKKYNLSCPLNERTLDIHTLSYAEHLRKEIPVPINKRRTNIDLDYTLKYVGLPPEPKPHKGSMGARLEAEAFSRLVFQKPYFEEFKGYPIKNLHEEESHR